MEDIDKEISEMKITLNARARIVAEEFLKHVSNCFIVNDVVLFFYHCVVLIRRCGLLTVTLLFCSIIINYYG